MITCEGVRNEVADTKISDLETGKIGATDRIPI